MVHLFIVLLITLSNLSFAASDDILLVYVDKKQKRVLVNFRLIDLTFQLFLKKYQNLSLVT